MLRVLYSEKGECEFNLKTDTDILEEYGEKKKDYKLYFHLS